MSTENKEVLWRPLMQRSLPFAAAPIRAGTQSRFANSGNSPGRDWCSSIHTLRDKSRLEMAEYRAIPAMAASQSDLTCRRISHQIQVNRY
ncbi:hypothetical protein [Novosphingobium album (ex Hu et al. 2023)]|uniref:Uncharacterized protein n=1 Tax=Novosphingobium album (ex Hu et al. 2023) TaxID=2930093 RepID=A0ABT0B778_9SPHN|nr:hypothetical protein [Novosphingobium album (ex Hu et al. 2023)]MCJ2180896.1 hypothetical protein [Novosphingobium album (ex Hu et al. 2023)]